ncbi:hypothetical protein FHG87_001371 [Trinorchestia longiramus]|nr:hypothetical protein FHG87_001371 [Trinorchestia longiramus]
MLAAEEKAEATMEYYEVSPVSQRIIWLNGQHMKMTAGFTALSWALGYLYDSRHPQVVWQPGCSVKLDRPKVNRIKGHTSHIHPVSCPAMVTTSVQTGTYLTFYLENFNTVDQCVLELEGLWKVHKENDDYDHRNKIWVIRVDTTDTHELQCHQPKAQDIFSDLSLLAPDFFTTRRSSKAQRLSPTKNRSRSGQLKKPPSYKINSPRKRSHKRSLTSVTASRIMQQAFTQCQQNLHGVEAVGGRDGQPEHSLSMRGDAVAAASLSYGLVTESEENWSDEEGENWSKIEGINGVEIEDKMSDAGDANWSEDEDENWNEFGSYSWSEIKNGNRNHGAENGFQNYEDDNCIQELKLCDKMNEIEGYIRADTENCTLICEDRNRNVKAVQINREHVGQTLEGYTDGTIKSALRKKESTNCDLNQRLGHIFTNASLPLAFPRKELSQLQHTSRAGSSCKGAHAVRGVAESIRKVHESLVDNEQSQTSISQSSITYNPIHSDSSPFPRKSNEKEAETKDTINSKANQRAEPKSPEIERHHKSMLVDLSKHEVVGTWLYSSDEEDDEDYDDDEGIYKKEEAFFRVDVTELMHELSYAREKEHSTSSLDTTNTSSKEWKSAQVSSSNSPSLEEIRTAFTTHTGKEKRDTPSAAEQIPEPEKCGFFEGEILREVQPKMVNTLDHVNDTMTGHELGKERIKERCSHNFESKNWSAMAKDVLHKTTRNVSNSKKNEMVSTFPNAHLNSTGKQSVAQSVEYENLARSRNQRTEAEENKENAMSSTYRDNENKTNLRNMVEQFEALSSKVPKKGKEIRGISPRGRGSLVAQKTETVRQETEIVRQETETVKQETQREVEVQLERWATSLDITSMKPHRSFSPYQFMRKNETIEVGSTKFYSTENSNNNKNEELCQQHSLESELRSSISRQVISRSQTNTFPLVTEIKTNNKQHKIHDTEHQNSRYFSASSDSSVEYHKNHTTSRFMGEQLNNSGNKDIVAQRSVASPSPSRSEASNFRMNSYPEPATDMHDSSRKSRSESLSLTCATQHDPPQRSASVVPSWESQPYSSSIEPNRQLTSSQEHNSESSRSLEETFVCLDRSGRRSPKLKHSVFMVKKQLSKSKELRILPTNQHNSNTKTNDSEQIAGTLLQTEQINGGADALQSKSYSETAPPPGTGMYKLQHRAKKASNSKNKEVTDLEHKTKDLPRLDRKNEDVLEPKPCTVLVPQSDEFHKISSRAAEVESEVMVKSVPESALVVFRLQPSTPHQAWQFKKAILKVHHRDNTKKREDKSTLKRNAHLLRKRR